MDRLDHVPPDPAGLLHRSALLGAGLAVDEIDRLVRARVLVPVRRGSYWLGDDGPRSPAQAHLLRARATVPHLAAGSVLGHVTAALALGLPVWNLPLDRVHAVRERSTGGGRRRHGTCVHRAPLLPGDVREVDGLLVTSPARTLVDLARTVPAEQTLVTVDAALHRHVRPRPPSEPPPVGATTVDELSEVITRFGGRRGTPAARRVLALADARSESPGESRSRFRMHLASLPAPVTQWEVPGLRFRTDFAWPEHGVVGEFDGRVKYGRSLRPGQDLGDVLWEEKRREDLIRSTGLTVVRWVWSDIADGSMVTRLTRGLGAHGTPPRRVAPRAAVAARRDRSPRPGVSS